MGSEMCIRDRGKAGQIEPLPHETEHSWRKYANLRPLHRRTAGLRKTPKSTDAPSDYLHTCTDILPTPAPLYSQFFFYFYPKVHRPPYRTMGLFSTSLYGHLVPTIFSFSLMRNDFVPTRPATMPISTLRDRTTHKHTNTTKRRISFCSS